MTELTGLPSIAELDSAVHLERVVRVRKGESLLP